MRLTVLIENTLPDAEANALVGLTAEHGLCVCVEANGSQIAADAGASDAAWRNAALLGVDDGNFDMLVVSHGHYDHTGGAAEFARRNPTAPIYVQRSALGDFVHLDPGPDARPRYIGVPESFAALPTLRLLDGAANLAHGVSVFAGIDDVRPAPRGNAVLKRRRSDGSCLDDDFRHEQCLVVEENGRRLLLSGCAHHGILNVLDRFRELYHTAPDLVLAGFHMRRKDGYEPQDLRDVRETARELKKLEKTRFYTGHCTGDEPCAILKEELGEQIVVMHTGMRVEL